MPSRSNRSDPWVQTVGLLALLSGAANAPPLLSAAAREAGRGELRTPSRSNPRKAAASVIDRPSSSSATISWCDPTSCRYVEQVWRASIARISGICALSGARINPGDAIYKPGRARSTPANADEMILSSVVNDVAQN
ncbi:DUF3331 domain-containing protein [Paraburkholderia ultramafica]|uniref:DUF3331 domain-containing protein n=1 Tax=Paraburkholderia ultramafica TaxID=1544867 RepID=UPI003CCD49AA